MTTSLERLRVKVFADGADLSIIGQMYQNPHIRGFTTNPTLMRRAEVPDYYAFARELLRMVPDRPVSLEVFSDDFQEMEDHAREIASWGPNVYVKVPVTDTRGRFSGALIDRLSCSGVQLNVTALLTAEQVAAVEQVLNPGVRAFVSVFAGRIADTGRDPVPIMRRCLKVLAAKPLAELIWASPRELLNVVQADAIGCHVITVTSDLLSKLHLLGKDLDEFSLETVRMFRDDALLAGYRMELPVTAPTRT